MATVQKIKINKHYDIPLMGTSGVRLKQEIYNQSGFLEQFIQGIANHLKGLDPDLRKKTAMTVVLGGDPRLGNEERIRIAAGILAANDFTVLIASPGGVATTPAMSHTIRHVGALAGIIFTASHNPYTDVGIKLNIHDGSPALSDIASSVHAAQNDPNLGEVSFIDPDEGIRIGRIKEIDTVSLYADLLDSIFDFRSLRDSLRKFKESRGRPFRIIIDGMGGAAGIYAREIFEKRLGASPILLRCDPDPYLGGPPDPAHPAHPEPDFDYIPELIKRNGAGQADLTAAYDSDGDRRLDGGGGRWIESADEFALFAKYAHLTDLKALFRDGKKPGTIFFARSAVTAPSIDLMETDLKKVFGENGMDARILQTATGFKWIAEYGNWGVEESNGLGNPWLREKDGIFATVYLLKIVLSEGKAPGELMEELWSRYGRWYFCRGEISAAPSVSPSDTSYEKELNRLEKEKDLLDDLIRRGVEDTSLVGKKFGGLEFRGGSFWNYVDPEGNVRAKDAAAEFRFDPGAIVKMRFSGTGSGGYTLRIYITRFDKRYDIPKKQLTEPVKAAVADFFREISGGSFENHPKNFNDEHQPDAYG